MTPLFSEFSNLDQLQVLFIYDKHGIRRCSTSLTNFVRFGSHTWSRNSDIVFDCSWCPSWAIIIARFCYDVGNTIFVPRKTISLLNVITELLRDLLIWP